MSTSRINELTEVKPTKTFYFFSAPCEVMAANTTNKLLKNMEKNDVAGVAFSYLEAKKGEREELQYIISGASLVATLFFFRILTNPEQLLNLLPTLAMISSSLTFHSAKEMAAKELIGKLGAEKFKTISQLNFNRKDIPKLLSFLKTESVNTQSIENNGKQPAVANEQPKRGHQRR